MLIVAGRIYARFWNSNLTVIFFDVGQGDCALVQFPKGKTALIDGGGASREWNVGERIVIPELTRRAILSLDHVFLSHPDADHAGGLSAVLRDLSVERLWYNGAFDRDRKPHRLFGELIALSENRRVRREPVFLPVEWRENGATLSAWVSPVRQKKTNNRSLLLELNFAGCRFLFTGDIEARAEESLVPGLRGPVTVLKVAHHGSKTSSTDSFLRRTSPRVAVISAGRTNAYGHPHPPVLQRLRRFGAEVFRTDFHGYLQFDVEPNGRLRCQSAQGFCGEMNCR